MTRYAELQTATNFSFLRGASHPWELVSAAGMLGMAAIGITDRNSLAGVVRAWTQMRSMKDTPFAVKALTGCRLDFADGTPSLLCYPSDREAYGRLTRLLTLGQLRAEKGGCELHWGDFAGHAQGQLVLIVPPARLDEAFENQVVQIAGDLRGDVWLAASRDYGPRDLQRISRLAALAERAGAPMVATNDVLYHAAERRPLQDVLTCIRETCTIHEAGLRLAANAERHLKSPTEMERLFARYPGAVERSLEIVERIEFDLSQLSYEYPDEPVPPGKNAIQHLRDLTWEGAQWRFEKGMGDKERRTLEHELDLIEKLGFANYFLTVHDIVRWAREQDILCQGRGSAANSCVCFCLGVTAVDPTKDDQDLLFSRFISEKRGEPPDIDVDFEHARREEVMQYVYRRYGRDRAAIVATVIHYRPRMAIRQVGKALGLTDDVTAALAGTIWGSWGEEVPDSYIVQAGLDPANREIRRAVRLATELLKFPRHLSQHVGGYVLTKRRLDETVPIGNAAMKDRTFIEWDKDDIDALGLMKVDVLALGMLTALKKSFDMIPPEDVGRPITDIAHIPQEVPEVYEMLSRADSVGVFQVESRAQMSMLPRLKPRKFYDLVIEVAIVRPGPIQGDMVHPYLKRRDKIEPVDYPRPGPEHPQDELENILRKTLGVPLFQEQAMRIAIEAAKFSDDDADGLRRSMATFRNLGSVGEYETKFLEGMKSRGYDPAFVERCFKQIEGFGSYGFPESHAISFALLVYASAWVKWRWPDAFLASLLNSQPMGFYQPAQLVRDAREHDVEVRGPDVLASDWDCTLEPATREGRLRAVRLGLRQIKGFCEDEADRLVAAREAGVRSVEGFAVRAGLSRRSLELLAEADAFAGLGLSRRQALWTVKGLADETSSLKTAPLLAAMGVKEHQVELPLMSLSHEVEEDYRTTSLSLRAHPISFFRESLNSLGAIRAADLKTVRDRKLVSVGGLVLVRQRPGTAKGVTFLTLEDETGVANIVVWQDAFAANRRLVMTASFMVVHGQIQSESNVIHVVARRFTDLSHRLAELKDEDGPAPQIRNRVSGGLIRSRDFH
ncbi:error-prone DNA polymerase [Phenylobacterium haematophilum]|uniref:Error-prone DNA polymerase n=1 Tax=Phenylobacterium haematophilum TaxID=98513 RepID=A0A840A2H9_9CAUL|nr:error-prone DNA polymerase [Phenylobacterium haematophilum]MBB3892514.1 error-prone DNA polymerase [Phenylobacterium haematophilum]